jgi:hypothetical protein
MSDPLALARLLLLLWAALVLRTEVGQAVAEITPAMWLPCKHKGPCLARMRVGQSVLPTMARGLHLSPHSIRAPLPPPERCQFPWLQTGETLV